MKVTFYIGIALLLLSAYPIYWMLVELSISNRAYERYSVIQQTGTDYDYKSAEFRGHRVYLSDNLEVDTEKLPKDENVYLEAPISTVVNGKDYSLSSPIEIRVFNGHKSYNSSAHILILGDNQSGDERLAVIQRVPGKSYPNDTRYRILFVSADGTVTEEWFGYNERHEPAYRTMLAKFAHPEPLGFKSQVLSFYPSIFYPVLYPAVTGLVGLLMSLISGILLIRRRNKSALR